MKLEVPDNQRRHVALKSMTIFTLFALFNSCNPLNTMVCVQNIRMDRHKKDTIHKEISLVADSLRLGGAILKFYPGIPGYTRRSASWLTHWGWGEPYSSSIQWNNTQWESKWLLAVFCIRFKGKVHRDFRPPIFFIIRTCLGHWSMGKNIIDIS